MATRVVGWSYGLPHQVSSNASRQMLKGLVVALLSTGGFDSHTTSGTTDLAAIARGAGLRRVAAVDSVMDFGEAVIEAFSSDELSVIVAKVAAIGPNHYGMDLHLPENAFRFERFVSERRKTSGIAG